MENEHRHTERERAHGTCGGTSGHHVWAPRASTPHRRPIQCTTWPWPVPWPPPFACRPKQATRCLAPRALLREWTSRLLCPRQPQGRRPCCLWGSWSLSEGRGHGGAAGQLYVPPRHGLPPCRRPRPPVCTPLTWHCNAPFPHAPAVVSSLAAASLEAASAVAAGVASPSPASCCSSLAPLAALGSLASSAASSLTGDGGGLMPWACTGERWEGARGGEGMSATPVRGSHREKRREAMQRTSASFLDSSRICGGRRSDGRQ